MSSIIEIKDVSKAFGGVIANQSISVNVAEGGITGLIGPNGSGKTTLFNSVVGHHPIDEGSIKFEGAEISKLKVPQIARLGLLRTFQQTRIYSKMNCVQNMQISIPHRNSGLLDMFRGHSPETSDRALELLEFVGLYSKRNLIAGDLSFGQQKLLEFAMALMNEPKVLLLDEPYRAMDALTKQIMHEALLETYDRTGVTIFFITHDLEEAIFLGDKVHIVTTRPCQLKKTVEVKIPRPRSYETQSSEDFRKLLVEVNEAVHEEAVKAFQAGERELA